MNLSLTLRIISSSSRSSSNRRRRSSFIATFILFAAHDANRGNKVLITSKKRQTAQECDPNVQHAANDNGKTF